MNKPRDPNLSIEVTSYSIQYSTDTHTHLKILPQMTYTKYNSLN